MVFKPFRPPLIRKLQPALPANTDTNQPRPSKRRRVGDDNGNDDDDEENRKDVEKGKPRSTSTAGPRFVSLSDIEVLEVDSDGGGDDVNASHFNVLWFVCSSPKCTFVFLISVLDSLLFYLC